MKLHHVAAGLLGLAIAIAPLGSFAQSPGTTLHGVLQTGLDSKDAYVGEPVSLVNVASDDGQIADARLLGTVTDVTRPGQGRNAQIRMHFDTLQYSDGTQQPVDGVVESMNVQTKSNAGKEALGALAGMLIGNAVGKTLLGSGFSGGGLIGAAGGFFVAKDNRSNVTIPQGSTITVGLQRERRQPERYRRQQPSQDPDSPDADRPSYAH